MSARAQAGYQRIAVGAGDGLLAGRIDRRDDDKVGVVEAGAELLEQIVQPRIAVRLHHRDHLALGAFAGGAQYRGDLDRMMRVIIDNDRAVPFADARESPLDATEAGKRLANDVGLDPERVCDRDGCGCVQEHCGGPASAG